LEFFPTTDDTPEKDGIALENGIGKEERRRKRIGC